MPGEHYFDIILAGLPVSLQAPMMNSVDPVDKISNPLRSGTVGLPQLGSITTSPVPGGIGPGFGGKFGSYNPYNGGGSGKGQGVMSERLGIVLGPWLLYSFQPRLLQQIPIIQGQGGSGNYPVPGPFDGCISLLEFDREIGTGDPIHHGERCFLDQVPVVLREGLQRQPVGTVRTQFE